MKDFGPCRPISKYWYLCGKFENDGIKDDSNNPALDVGNRVVADLWGVGMIFAVFLLSL
jgi:hypothetical protein